MMREVKHRAPFAIPQANFIDRAVSFISPGRAERRMRSRLFMALTGAYYGGSKNRRSLREWYTSAGDADGDILPDLPTLRERSRDLARNNPLASGAIKTKTTSVVGTGLRLKSRINRDILGLDEEAADTWERHTEAEWRLWADSTDCDVEDTLNFYQIQELCFRSTLENGDIFILTPAAPANLRTYELQLQLIEADRVCNEHNASDSDTLAGGIEKNKYGGAPLRYHIIDGHPGNIYSNSHTWAKVNVRGAKTGRRNVLHLFHKIRVGQSRGVPDLAPVIELFKQLGRYSEAEISAAVLSSFFTVFVKSEYSGAEGLFRNLGPMQPTDDIGGKSSDKDFKMSNGAILDLAPGEDVSFANPSRPNQVFAEFVSAIESQISVGIELPHDVFKKKYEASYSAARSAMLDAWKFYLSRRKWLTDSLCRPVFELFLTEAISRGRVVAPGFLNGDPLIKQAWLGQEWIGPAKGAIDETKEVKAAAERVNMGVSTLDEETVSLTGGDWETKHRQRAKEIKKRKEDGLEQEPQAQGENQNEPVVQDTGQGEE